MGRTFPAKNLWAVDFDRISARFTGFLSFFFLFLENVHSFPALQLISRHLPAIFLPFVCFFFKVFFCSTHGNGDLNARNVRRF